MSVLKNERSEGLMEVQNKSYDLASYTIHAAGSEKIVPKHHRWSIGYRLVSIAMDIAEEIDMANSMSLHSNEEYNLRIIHQNTALAKTFALSTAIHTARKLSNFDAEKQKYWIGLVIDVQNLIRRWKESDRTRTRRL